MSNKFKTKCNICGRYIIGEEYFAIENSRFKRRVDIDYCLDCEKERVRLTDKSIKAKEDLDKWWSKLDNI